MWFFLLKHLTSSLSFHVYILVHHVSLSDRTPSFNLYLLWKPLGYVSYSSIFVLSIILNNKDLVFIIIILVLKYGVCSSMLQLLRGYTSLFDMGVVRGTLLSDYWHPQATFTNFVHSYVITLFRTEYILSHYLKFPWRNIIRISFLCACVCFSV